MGIPSSPFPKSYFSPMKMRSNDFQPNHNCPDAGLEEALHTPSRDGFRTFWLQNLDSTNWMSLKYRKSINTPLSKEYVKPFTRGTPMRDIRDCYDDISHCNEDAFISPKFKELSFGKDMAPNQAVGKSPLLKQVYGTPLHASEFLDDDITKAEFSNLFSNKSNNAHNL